MKIPAWFRFQGGAALWWQLLLVCLTWAYLCRLHWNNDGLWYQGDAPRHAANGLFWKDFLLSLPLDPKGYALSYYARYPVINPTSYPPVFYWLEALLFGTCGPSPHLAKGLVLLFALVAALYTTAWLRRWVAEEAGWAGALVLLLPGVVFWSQAIMLNVPAFALSVAALYHARRWLEAPPPAFGAIFLVAAWTIVAIFTYLTAAVVILIIAAWLAALRRWDLLWNRRTAVVAVAFCGLVILPATLAVIHWAPVHVEFLKWIPGRLGDIAHWTYYPLRLDDLFTPHVTALAGLGMVLGLCGRRWRRETLLLAVWLAVAAAFFSCFVEKDTRYILLLSTPVVVLCTIAVWSMAAWLGSSARRGEQVVKAAAVTALLAANAWHAARVRVPSVEGVEEVVSFLEQVAPAEPIFYDGYYDGVFAFYVQARDPGYCRRAVLGSKLLYAYAFSRGWHERDFASSPPEVVDVLQERGGCRWLAIERSQRSQDVPPARYLREAVRGPEFELVKSFPSADSVIECVDVYRLLLPIKVPEEVDLPFPILGDDVSYRAKPIRRTHAGQNACQ